MVYSPSLPGRELSWKGEISKIDHCFSASFLEKLMATLLLMSSSFQCVCSQPEKIDSQRRKSPQICQKSVRDFLRTISIGYEFEYGDQWDESAVMLHAHCSQDLIGLRTPRTLRRFWGALTLRTLTKQFGANWPMRRPCCLATWQSCQICHSSVRKFLIDYTTLIEIYII